MDQQPEEGRVEIRTSAYFHARRSFKNSRSQSQCAAAETPGSISSGSWFGPLKDGVTAWSGNFSTYSSSSTDSFASAYCSSSTLCERSDLAASRAEQDSANAASCGSHADGEQG